MFISAATIGIPMIIEKYPSMFQLCLNLCVEYAVFIEKYKEYVLLKIHTFAVGNIVHNFVWHRVNDIPASDVLQGKY